MEVDEAARSAHDDVDAGVEDVDLLVVRATAVDGGHAQAHRLGDRLEILADLHGQLAGRDDDQRARRAVRLRDAGVVEDAVDEGDAEAQRLAHARAGLADDVGAVERQRQSQLLDGEGSGDAPGRQGIADFGRDPQFDERRRGKVCHRESPSAGCCSVVPDTSREGAGYDVPHGHHYRIR